MDDWNDLRLVLAIARAESLNGAAASLGIDHSTVYRRLNTLEGRLGARLFERLPAGAYAATEAGARMIAAAARVEAETAAIDREIAGRDERLSGRLRVTSSETLAYSVLTRHVARFQTLHPDIVVELAIDNRLLDLSRREADVALRVTRPDDQDLHGRKLADIGWTAYGRHDLIGRHAPLAAPADLAGKPLIGWETEAAEIKAASWLAAVAPAETVVYRTNSLINQLVAARAGIGLAVLPCYLGDAEPDLARAIAAPIPELNRELWIITHADLRRTARVRAFLDVIGKGILSERGRLTGDGAPFAAAVDTNRRAWDGGEIPEGS